MKRSGQRAHPKRGRDNSNSSPDVGRATEAAANIPHRHAMVRFPHWHLSDQSHDTVITLPPPGGLTYSDCGGDCSQEENWDEGPSQAFCADL
jgi:hypothetical protein